MKWVVRNKKNQTRGPFSTDEIMNFIAEGVFTGEETIAQFPEGQWNPITKESIFYEKIMDTLENPAGSAKSVTNDEPKNDMEQETVIVPPPAKNPNDSLLQKIEKKRTVQLHTNVVLPQAQVSLPKPENQKSRKGSKSSVIELKSLDRVNRNQVYEKLMWPALGLAGVALVIMGLLYFEDEESSADKIHLLAPTKKADPLSEAQVKERTRLAVKAIERDSFENYLEAQNILVAAIEGSPRSLEPRSLLCYVYKELWPYATQDTRDQKTIDYIVQSTKTINLIDPNGTLCEIVKMITTGRLKDARSTTDSLLELGEQFSLYPLLFSMKAEILEADRDFTNSIPYFEKAMQLWPPWVKPKAALGWSYYKLGDAVKAADHFRLALQSYPKHKFSLLGLGIVEFKSFNQIEAAFNHLSAGVESSSRTLRFMESEGLESLAEIFMMKNQKSKAQGLACQSLEISPGRKEAKELCSRLGGDVTVVSNNAHEELIILGDQYMRSGDFLSAQAEYKAAFDMNPKSAEAALKVAKCLWALNQSIESIEWLSKAVRADSKLIKAYALQADYLSQRYDFASAEQSLLNASRVSKNNHEIFRSMALVAFRKNDFQSAINLATRASKVYDGDVETYVILANSSRELALRMRAADDKERVKKDNLVKDSMRYATKAVELDATSSEAQITFAKMLASTSGVDSGINYVNELIKKYASASEYKVALAEILMNEERYRQAIEVLEQVTTFEMKNKKALLALALCYKAIGLMDKSLSTYLRAAVIDSTDAEALFQAGKIYMETNRFEEAYQQFQRVLKINPRYPRTNYYIARTSFLSGNLSEALDQVNQEKKLYPTLSDSYILAAEIHTARLKYSDCAAEYSKAMKLSFQGADIYVKAARCYRLSGSLDIAEDMLALAKDRESGYAEIFREQGAIFQSRGSNAEALRAYETYLELSPNAPDKTEIESQMSRIGG